MNNDLLKAKWTQAKGEMKSKWGKLTDDEVDELQGDYEKTIGKLQEKYSERKEDVKTEFDEWIKKL